MMDVQGLLSRGRRSSATVGVGLSAEAEEVVRSDLSRMGSSVSIAQYSRPDELVSALAKGTVSAAIRGTLSSHSVLRELKSSFGVSELMRAAVMESASGKPFLLAPVGIDEGRDAAARLRIALHTARYFGQVGWNLRVGVVSRGRSEDASRGRDIEESLREGEQLVQQLKSEGIEAVHCNILIEDAVADTDLVLVPDGVSGNLVFRSVHFIGGGKAFGAPVVNLPKVFVDTSRAKRDYSDSVLLAAGLSDLLARGKRAP